MEEDERRILEVLRPVNAEEDMIKDETDDPMVKTMKAILADLKDFIIIFKTDMRFTLHYILGIKFGLNYY